MKQSSGRASLAYLSCRTAVFGIAAMLTGAATVSGCRSNSSANCPNLPQATTLIGQTNYTLNTANPGGISASTVGGPQGSVATTANGSGSGTYLFVPDTKNNRVLVFAPEPKGSLAGAATFVIGQGSQGSTDTSIGSNAWCGSTACTSSNTTADITAIGLASPQKVSISDTGTQLVVTDSGNNRVLIWNSLSNLESERNGYLPDVVIGQPDLLSNAANQCTTSPCNPSASSLYDPTAAVIANGHLVVVDKDNNRVLIWNTIPTANNQPADIELGQATVMSVPTGATNPTTNEPIYADVDCAGNTNTQPPNEPANNFCFTTNTTGDDTFNNSANAFTLGMDQPTDVWTDGRSNLFVSDTTNNRVLYWNTIPTEQNQLANNLFGVTKFGTGFGVPGSGTQGLNAPTGVNSDGNYLYVADTGNNRVLQFALAGGVNSNGAAAIEVWGQQDFSHATANDPDQNGQIGDQRNSPPTNGVTAGTLDGPTGVFADASTGLLYITDSVNQRVLVFPISSGVNGTYTNLC